VETVEEYGISRSSWDPLGLTSSLFFQYKEMKTQNFFKIIINNGETHTPSISFVIVIFIYFYKWRGSQSD